MSDREWGVLVSAHLVLFSVGVAYAAWCRRGIAELRVRLLEAMAAAVRRGVPLAPLVWKAAESRRGRLRAALVRLSEDIEAGVPLATALRSCRRLRVPEPVAASIEAADGSPALAGVLAASAREQGAARTWRHRVRGALTHPAVVVLLAAPLFFASSNRLAQLADSMEMQDPMPAWIRASFGLSVPADVAGWTLIGAAVTWMLLRLVRACRGLGGRPLIPASPFGLVPPFRGPSRLGGAAAFLDTLAAQLRGGRALPESARCAALAAGDFTVRRGGRRFAAGVERGDAAAEAWDLVPLPASVRPRAVLALSRADAPGALERLAAECRERRDAAVEARLRWLGPLAIGIVAWGVASLGAAFFTMQGSLFRATVSAW